MDRPVARLGDPISHGGTIISGDETILVNARPLARVGDLVDCSKHGRCKIISGVPGIFGSERPFAVVGSMTSCGATIIAGSPDTFADVPQGSATGKFLFIAPVDEQVRVVNQDTGRPVPDYPYRIETSEGTVYKGRTDQAGLTPRIHTDEPQQAQVWLGESAEQKFTALKSTEEPKQTIETNPIENSVVDIPVTTGRIFFDISYIVRDRAFERAARTIQIEATENGDFREDLGDIWLSYPVTTETDFKAAWNDIVTKQRQKGMKIAQGHLLTHASIGGFLSGLEFTDSEQDDGTLSFMEIASLAPLDWTEKSTLVLYGCRTGLVDSSSGIRPIQKFRESQDVGTIFAQRGWAYFSSQKDIYSPINEDPSDQAKVYLWAYRRKKNYIYESPFETGGERMYPYYMERARK